MQSDRALLNDMNVKLSYIIQLLREERHTGCRYVPTSNGNGENGNGGSEEE